MSQYRSVPFERERGGAVRGTSEEWGRGQGRQDKGGRAFVAGNGSTCLHRRVRTRVLFYRVHDCDRGKRAENALIYVVSNRHAQRHGS